MNTGNDPVRIRHRVLIGVICLILPGISLATTPLWTNASNSLPGSIDESSCSLCHSIGSDNDLRISRKFIEHDDSTLDIDFSNLNTSNRGVTGFSYSWRYDVRNDGNPSSFRQWRNLGGNDRRGDARPYRINLGGTSGNATIDYCLGQNLNSKSEIDTGNGSREYFCGTFVVERADPPPVITAPVLSPSLPDLNFVAGGAPKRFSSTATFDPSRTVSIIARSSNRNVAELIPQPTTTVFTPGTRTASYSVVPGIAGNAIITVTATDNANSSLSRRMSFSVTVNEPDPIDAAPVITSVDPGRSLSLEVDQQARLTLNISDDGLSTLSYQGQSANPTAAELVNNNDGSFFVMAREAGDSQLTLSVSDAAGTAMVTVDINVRPKPVLNQPPVAQADDIVITDTSGSQLLDVLANDSDPDGDALTIRLGSTTSQLGVTLAVENNAIRYMAPADFSQVDSFNYQAVDSQNAVSSTVTVTVKPSDEDSDGVFDSIDNCPVSSNADQGNMDGDALGDVCDPDPDGDGIPGLSGQQLGSGKEFVQNNCLLCHLNDENSAPQFGDAEAWAQRLQAAGSINTLVESAINGKGAMPAFGNTFTAMELTEAVLYLSGEENDPSGVVDIDLDQIANVDDNCERVPNPDQADSDNNGVGDVCEPNADADGDGYVFSLDDDDSNANRLPGRSGSTTAATYFLAENSLSLGTLARNAAEASNNERAGVLLNDADFLSASRNVYTGVDPALDTNVAGNLDIMDIQLLNVSGGRAQVIVQLFSRLPLDPALRLYMGDRAQWLDFIESGTDGVASAPAIRGICPSAESTNFTSGLTAGLQCVRITLADGGVNDADGLANGSVEFTARIGSLSENGGTVTPPAVVTNPKKGGGSMGWLMMSLLTLCHAVRRSRLMIVR